MAINEWMVWQKIGLVKPKKRFIDYDKDLNAVVSFVKEASPLLRDLLDLTIALKSLRKKEIQLRKKQVPDADLKPVILEQVRLFDKLLKIYEFFQMDADVNGVRVKRLSRELGKKAVQANIDPHWLEIINKSERWTFNW